jgi:triacylglycerol lipase
MSCRRLGAAALALIFSGWFSAPRSVAAEAAYQTLRNVVYVERSDEALHADVYRPSGEGPFPGVLCVHGGAWAAGNKNQVATIAELLAVRDYTAVAINYRLAPQHKFPAQIEDCRQAVTWMRQNAKQYQIDPDRLAGWGYSAGGHLVLLLGLGGAGLKAVVAGGAPCDFRQTPPDNQALTYWLGGTRRQLPEVYSLASPAALVSPHVPPILFYHGEKDNLVNIAQPTAMVRQLKQTGADAELYVVPQAGHLGAFLNRDALTAGLEFLDKRLQREASAPHSAGERPIR